MWRSENSLWESHVGLGDGRQFIMLEVEKLSAEPSHWPCLFSHRVSSALVCS